MNKDKPKYKHDCIECKYLGIFVPSDDTFQPIAEYDLYAHLREQTVELIARYSDNAPDYLSGCYFIGYSEEENTCLQMPIYKEIFDRYNENISRKNYRGNIKKESILKNFS